MLRLNYHSEKERQEQNMFGKYKPAIVPQNNSNDDQEDINEINNVLDTKSKQIEEDFKVLKQKFLEAAEKKMEDIKTNDSILEEIERIRKMHTDLKQENAELKSTLDILNNKLDSKTRLNEHLEEKCANILIEKEDIIIKLKAEIVALKKKVKKMEEKHISDLDSLNNEKNKYIKDNQEIEEKLQKIINAQANFDSDFKKKKLEMKKLSDEFKKYKKETKNLIDEKNLLIKEYEDRVKKLSELKQQITMVNQEKEEIENELNIVRSQIKFLNLKENFYK